METKKIILVIIASFILNIDLNAQFSSTWPGGPLSQYNSMPVGIQTPSSTLLSGASLDLGNNLSIRGTHLIYNSTNGVIDWGGGGSGDLWFRRLNTQGVFGSGYSNLMVIKASGNVGIGSNTTSPITLLHVGGDMTFGSATNKRKWRFITQNGIDHGKMFLLPDDPAGAADYTRSFTIDPRDAYSNFTFGHDAGIFKATIGRAWGITANTGTMYLGFNAIYNNQGGTFERCGNATSANGGALIWAGLDGTLSFTSFASTGVNNDNTATTADVLNKRAMIIKQSAAGIPQVLIGKDDLNGSSPHIDYSLAVDGKIAAKDIVVTFNNWPDYVFAKEYELLSLDEVKTYIGKNQHLPGVPDANEVTTNGFSLRDGSSILMQKIEELTLYMIQLDEEMKTLKRENAELRNALNKTGK